MVRCISEWFGSTESFESLVQDKLRTVLVHQLANHVFSYSRIVQAMSPTMWVVFDMWTGQWIADGYDLAMLLEIAAGIILYGLFFLPSNCLVLLRLAYKARHLSSRTSVQALLSAGLVATGALMFGLFVMAERSLAYFVGHVFGNSVYASAVTLPVMGLVTVLLWRCMPSAEIV